MLETAVYHFSLTKVKLTQKSLRNSLQDLSLKAKSMSSFLSLRILLVSKKTKVVFNQKLNRSFSLDYIVNMT
jgi:hypothetical protein